MEKEAREKSLVLDHWTPFSKVQIPSRKNTPACLKKYYKDLRKEYQSFKKIFEEDEPPEVKAAREARERVIATRCVQVTFVVCVFFVIGKAVAATLSNSVALFTSLADNAMEVVCTIIMWTVNAIMRMKMPYRFPHGQARLESLGILMFSMVMMMTGVMMIEKIVDDIIADVNGHELIEPTLDVLAIAVLTITIVVKIIMFLVMRRIDIPTVQTLSKDHRNDTLANLVALVAGLLGEHWWPYLDPIGGVMIALYIIIMWTKEGFVSIWMASGHAAPSRVQRLITWAAITLPGNYVIGVTSLKTCSTGETYNVEMNVLACPAGIISTRELKRNLENRVGIVNEVAHVYVTVDYIPEDGFQSVSMDLTDMDVHELKKKDEDKGACGETCRL